MERPPSRASAAGPWRSSSGVYGESGAGGGMRAQQVAPVTMGGPCNGRDARCPSETGKMPVSPVSTVSLHLRGVNKNVIIPPCPRGSQIKHKSRRCRRSKFSTLRKRHNSWMRCRVFYCYDTGTAVWALSGFVKKTQQTPIREIAKALKIKRSIGL